MICQKSLSLGFVATLLVSGVPMLMAKPVPAKAALAKAGDKALRPKATALAAPVKVTTVEGITEYRLANGLRVLLFPDPGKPTITVNITYLVGSRHENYGETGMAHLLEHLVFKGTPKHPDIPKELTEHGARPNGSTWLDRTNYFETFQATEENLKWALELEADRMVNSFISKKHLWDPETQKGEMSVVRNELERGENDPFRVLMQRVQGAAYQWHSYGKSTIGCRADVENVNEARLQAFYRNYYQPDNAVLLVSGKIDEAKTLAQINGVFGRIPKPTRVLDPTYTLEPTQDGEHQVVVRRVGDIQAAVVGYHLPAGTDPDFAAFEVLNQILADTPTGRLHKSLVETKKAVAIFSQPMATREPGFVQFILPISKESPMDDAKDTLLKELEDPAKKTFTAEEVDRAKTQLLKQAELALNDANNLGLMMSEYIAMGDWRMFFLDRDRVKAVTTADVERVAKAYLKPSNRTLGLFIPTAQPDRAEIPAVKDVEAMVKDYKGQAAVSQGEAFDPAALVVESRIQYATAPSGMKLAILPKKSRGSSVSFQFRILLGDEKSLQGKDMQTVFATNLLMHGTSKHTRAELADLLDKAKAQVSIGGDGNTITVQGETKREQFPQTMGLVAEMLKDSVFPEKEVESFRQMVLASLDMQRSEPSARASQELARLMDPYPEGHPLHASSLDENAALAKAVKLDDIRAFHKAFFGFSKAYVSVVGDVDAQETQKLMFDLFGNWQNPTPAAWIPRQVKAAQPQQVKIETPDKPNAFFVAGLSMPLMDTDTEYPALALGNFMLGGGFLNSRLAVRIRQKEGLSYGVGSRLQSECMDKASTWTAQAIYAPQNLARLETAFREELDKMLKDGFTAEEIKAAKSGYLQQRKMGRSQDGELANFIAGNLEFGRTFTYDEGLEKAIDALTNDQILAAVRKYIDPAKLVIVKAGDFAKVQPKQ